MVEEHYPNLGFTPLADATRNLYVLEIDTYIVKECYIKKKL
jgi:hypothetical protein